MADRRAQYADMEENHDWRNTNDRTSVHPLPVTIKQEKVDDTYYEDHGYGKTSRYEDDGFNNDIKPDMLDDHAPEHDSATDFVNFPHVLNGISQPEDYPTVLAVKLEPDSEAAGDDNSSVVIKLEDTTPEGTTSGVSYQTPEGTRIHIPSPGQYPRIETQENFALSRNTKLSTGLQENGAVVTDLDNFSTNIVKTEPPDNDADDLGPQKWNVVRVGEENMLVPCSSDGSPQTDVKLESPSDGQSMEECGDQTSHKGTYFQHHQGKDPDLHNTGEEGTSICQADVQLAKDGESPTQGKPYKCQTCGKGFSHPYLLDRHAIKHVMEKKFECRTCGKKFANASSLSEHEIAHTKKKKVPTATLR